VFQAAQPERLLRLSLADPPKAAEQAAAAGLEFAGVVGVDDDTAVAAAHIAARLGLPHASVPACEAARDKHRQRELMSRHGVSVPRFQLLHFGQDLGQAATEVRYPCVLKPTHLSMSRGVIRADDRASFIAAARRVRRIVQDCGGNDDDAFLVEDFIGGPEVAVEGMMRDGALEVLAIFDKPDPLEGPFFEETIYATPSTLPGAAQAALVACVRDAARAIGLDRGPVHAEVRWSGGHAVLIELAARPIGGRCSNVLRFEGGVTLEDLVLSRALNRAAAPARLADGASAVMMIPTPRAGILRSVGNADAARAVEGIDGLDITVAPGQRLVPLPEGSRYLGFIYARAARVEDAVSALRTAHARLDIVIE